MSTEKHFKILGINTSFESLNYDGFDEYSINSVCSFYDYDAVIINADYLIGNYNNYEKYNGKPLLSEESSHQIVEDFKRTKEQIEGVLSQGKNVFVLVGNNDPFCIYTGEHTYSGTGRNARRTNYVTDFNATSFLPIDVSFTHIVGDNYEILCNQPFRDFFDKIKGNFYYSSYFNAKNGTCLLKIPNTDKAISAVFEQEKGKLIFLPMPYYEDEYETTAKWKKHGKTFLDALFELNTRLTSTIDGYQLPEWTYDFEILDECWRKCKIESELEKLQKLKDKIQKQQEDILKLQQYKMLLSATGEYLEEIVKVVLSEIGFTLVESEKGRSDIIAKFNDIDVVAEIKGVTKSAAEKHAAQLEKWVSQFIEEYEITPKALLIVNAFCDVPIKKRTEAVFPNQMLKYCESRNHILLSTTQLLCLYIDIKNSPECKDEKINELLSSVGIYEKYKNIDEYLKQKESK